jgi:predicted RNA binding protein YcfA (HicA-like mRNA interferase family)
VGRLGNLKYRDVTRRLKAHGFAFDRQATGSHEIWYSPVTGRFTTVPNHPGNLPEGTVRAIVKQAGLTPESFMAVG